MRRVGISLMMVAVLAMGFGAEASAQGKLATRPPQFTNHVPPLTTTPAPRSNVLEVVDVGVLVLALALASFIALRKRSRREMVLLTVASMLYFGFWRKGCVCPVGSLQNIAAALFDSTYAIPLTVVAFFAVPLIFTLFFGRVFCAAVCPLGAMQELVVIRSRALPAWLNEALSVFPYLYLGMAVALAATGAGFVICKLDPFIGFYRFGASFSMFLVGAGILLIGMFVGRPYCRFLCPYGVILNWLSKLSLKHVTITPNECIQCRLCEEACPYDSILIPTPEKAPEPRRVGARRLAVVLAAIPLLVAGGAFVCWKLAVPLSMNHKTVYLAEQIMREEAGELKTPTVETKAFREMKGDPRKLVADALAVRQRIRVGAAWAGGLVGLLFGCQLVGLSVRRRRLDYVPDRGSCVSCTRCFSYCPKEHERLNKIHGRTNPDSDAR